MTGIPLRHDFSQSPSGQSPERRRWNFYWRQVTV